MIDTILSYFLVKISRQKMISRINVFIVIQHTESLLLNQKEGSL